MTRRKLCVVCLEEPAQVDWYRCLKCDQAIGQSVFNGHEQIASAARRARAFERRRWKAKGKAVRK